MKTLITLLCTLFLVACGASSTVTPQTPAVFDGPPWHQFTAQEKERYESGKPNCSEATIMVTAMSEWDSFDDGSTLTEVAPGVFIDLVLSPVGEMGLIQFQEKADGVRVVELAMTEDMLNSGDMFMDYYVFRAIDTGAASPEDDSALSLATGEYFCVYNSNI